jgi:hypothetical protein
VPLLEGEAGLYRTGSDGCLPETVEREQPELLAGVELGPNLGMVKSSSLESLHNMVSHSIIKREGVGLRGVARAPPITSSLRRPIDPRSGVVPIPTFPGSPTSKKSQKKSIFKKVFKKKKSSKNKSSGGKEKPGASPSDYDTRSMDGDLEEEGERRGSDRTVHTPDGYDSNDELLATIAKV